MNVIIVSACQPPGAAVAHRFARAGARVIVLDGDAEGLARLSAPHADRIEPLVVERCEVETLRLFKDAWEDQPLHLVVNLMPLAWPRMITEQMNNLSMCLRTMARGLVAGRGCLVSVVARPDDPLALVAQGQYAAMRSASAALGEVMAPRSVQVHLIGVPSTRPEISLDALLHLSSPEGRVIQSTDLDLG